MENFDNGSMISGKWMNMQTGQISNIVNTVIDGDDMILITDSGEQIQMAEFSSNYVQCDDSEVMASMANFTPDVSSFNTEKPIIDDTLIIPENTSKQSETDLIIRKFFDKISTKPKIQISINWPELSYEKLNLFIDMLDINTDDISKYIRQQYIDDISIILAINNFLTEKITKK